MGIGQNLRSFAHGHPPLLVFMTCLTALGVTMVALAHIIGNTNLPNPDIDMDWNVFLTRLSELHFCVGPRSDATSFDVVQPVAKQNTSSAPGNSTSGVPGVKAVDRAKSLYALLPDIGAESLEDGPNVTVAVSVLATFFAEAVSSPVLWHGKVRGYMLGIPGKRSKEELHLSMLLWPRNSNKAPCQGKNCKVMVDLCLFLKGPSYLLPKTRRPPQCILHAVPPSTNQRVFLQRSAADTGGKVNCTGGRWTQFFYKTDPTLTVMLSSDDRALVNLHLINTSYFLFFMVMVLACYAVVWGRVRKTKGDKHII
ncbi:transmembrane protein 248-like isoform X2 [Ornithodoros turicata]|uniref:transmembrane protein 248-like isoform X2 n=1 Tax=Ornithodoros turicata TaxID=34597 RepID=UPI0031387436